MPQEKNAPAAHDDKTAEFIRTNRDRDIRTLSLKKANGVDMRFALEQIAGFQKARRKLPQWWAAEGLLYPPPVSMEQCSSEQTARYKASLTGDTGKHSMADLTGGFGVDFSYMSRGFDEATYVERDERLCHIARHNFRKLGLKNARVVCADCEDYLQEMNPVDIIFIDPARRNANGGRTFAIGDCTPNVAAIMPRLLEKATKVIVKLSPMLDWHKTVNDFQGHVAEVHIVAVNNECKELLLIITAHAGNNPKIVCRNDSCEFSYHSDDASMAYDTTVPTIYNIRCSEYLLVPNAAIMKAGCFRQIGTAYGIAQLSENSHLFISPSAIDTFPGKHYRITDVTTMNKKELRNALRDINRANISVRNFPLSAEELRKRLKMRDGGDTYIFATTLHDGSHVLIISQAHHMPERCLRS